MSATLNLENLKITWLGHASFKIKNKLVIYIDPYQVADEKAEIIFITHSHFDHCDPASIRDLADEKTIIVAPEDCFAGLNIGKQVAIKEGEEKELGEIKVKAVPAYNKDKRFHPRGFGLGYLLEIEGKKIYHAGDTDCIPEMAELKDIDLALLPIGGTYTMDEREAAEAVRLIKPKIVVPMHYGKLAETPGDPIKFKNLVEEISEVRILTP